MEIKDCILTRRSIRKFANKEISDETIKNIVNLAIYAPSWKNSQTVRYLIIKNKDVKNSIINNAIPIDWNKNIINGAGALVVELTMNGISGYNPDGTPTTTKNSHWQSFDAGLSAQTFCLAAHNEGLGSVILGIFDENKVKETLNINDNFSISALIAIGYPDQNPSAPKRNNIDEVMQII